MDYIINFFQDNIFNTKDNIFNFAIFIINLIIFIFGKYIIKYLDTSELYKRVNKEDQAKKLKTLQFINFVLFFAYLLALVLDRNTFQHIILSLFTVLVIYIINSILIIQIIKFYGKEIETNKGSYFQESPTSEIFSLVLNIFSFVLGLVIILNIFDLHSWLESGGVIGGLLAFLGLTANNWAPDVVSGLQLLHSKRIKQGDVVRIKELDNKEMWIKTISLTEIKLIDLITDNGYVIRTSNFRNYNVENISIGITNIGKDSYIQYIDLKLGYGTKFKDIEEICFNAFSNLKNKIETYEDSDNEILNSKYKLLKRAINGDNDIYLEIIDNADHSINYRFFYTIFNAKSIVKIRNMLNKELYIESEKKGIGLNTPLTIDILKNNIIHNHN